jgi:FSR family fosmidomycin resistance protein-like MFS transporter
VSTPSHAASHHAIVLPVLFAISTCHLLNDLVQSLIPAVYPILKESFQLNYTQIGLITLTFQIVASLLQPLIGLYTDKRPLPFSLPAGMAFTLSGLLLLAAAPSFGVILLAAALVGIGSAIFHPESSRVARMASGGHHGFAQSLFQVGGNSGSAIGPLLAAYIVLRNGQASLAWFAPVVVVAIVLLTGVGLWYKRHHLSRLAAKFHRHTLPPSTVRRSLGILMLLTFSKNFYLASITSYYTFFLMQRFQISVQSAQIHLFVFLGAVAAGTIVGGAVGDRFGRKFVIWVSILGVLPFTLALPYASLAWTGVFSVLIGFILASAFSAILVYAQELVPGKVGMISGLFFGFAFGIAGIGAAALGRLADYAGVEFVYHVCSFLPLMGLLTAFLPNMERPQPVLDDSGPARHLVVASAEEL